MKSYFLMFEYDCKRFMDINNIIKFRENLEKVEKQGYIINIIFYGDASNEELATFMGYFNNLLQKDICKISISLKTRELIVENGINNKSIKLSTQNAKEVKNKKFDNLIKEYYKTNENIEVKVLPTKNWESIILDFIGE